MDKGILNDEDRDEQDQVILILIVCAKSLHLTILCMIQSHYNRFFPFKMVY